MKKTNDTFLRPPNQGTAAGKLKLIGCVVLVLSALVLVFYLNASKGYNLKKWHVVEVEDSGITLLAPAPQMSYGSGNAPYAYAQKDHLGVQVWRFDERSETAEDLERLLAQFQAELAEEGNYNHSSDEKNGWQFGRPDYAISRRTDLPHIEAVGLSDTRNCIISLFPVGDKTYLIWLSSEGSTGSIFKTQHFIRLAKEYFDQIAITP